MTAAPVLDPRAVATIAAVLTLELAAAIADVIAETGWDAFHSNRLLGLGWVAARHGDLVDDALWFLLREVEEGKLLGTGDVFTDDHDMTASEFTRLTMAAPWEYVGQAAEQVVARESAP